MKIYRGERRIVRKLNDTRNVISLWNETNVIRGICAVTVNYSELKPAINLTQNNQVFEWGYTGTLPENLSKSILQDYFETDNIPPYIIWKFKMNVIKVLPFKSW